MGSSMSWSQLEGQHQTPGVHQAHHYVEKREACLLGTAFSQVPIGVETTTHGSNWSCPWIHASPPRCSKALGRTSHLGTAL